MPDDSFPGQMRGIVAPTDDFDVVTPSNTTDLARLPRKLWAATPGDVSVHNKDGGVVTFTVLGGHEIPIRPRRVLEATTATLIALY